ncbi:MAG: polysaccharide deacetylase family protein [Armatimonadota bacterium]
MLRLDTGPSFILRYGRIGSPLARSTARGQHVLPALLRWQVRELTKRGGRPLTVCELLSMDAADGRCAFTFDGGYLPVAEQAWPILSDAQTPATVFVVANLIGGTNWWDQRQGDREERLLGKRELREMAAAGWEIGSQSASHARLTLLAPVPLREEIRGSKAKLEDLLGAPVAGFCYPFGEWNARVRDAVVEAGYAYAVAGQAGALSGDPDAFALPRIEVGWNAVGALLWRRLEQIREGGETVAIADSPLHAAWNWISSAPSACIARLRKSSASSTESAHAP